MCLQICLPGCRRSPQSPIVDRQSSIDNRTSSNFRRVCVSFTATPSLPCAFHSPIHDFQDTKKPIIVTVIVWKHIFDASSIGLSGGDEHCEVDCNFRLELRHVCSRFWGNAVAALHCTSTQTFREYFPVGFKKLEFVESATDEEK